MKQQKGFTLIELMIVVAIIAILAAFAVPAYFGYIKQAKVAEASVLFAGFKTNLAVWYATKSVWPTFQELKDAGIVYKGTYVEGTYDDVSATAGTPQVCFKVVGFDMGKDSIGWKYVSKIPGTDPWSCKMPDSGCTTIENKYLPPNCI